MNEKYNYLFNQFGFNTKRNDVFEQFNFEINSLIKSQNSNLTNLRSKFDYYIKEKNSNNITISDFTFEIGIDGIIFFHKDYPNYFYSFKYLKKFQIYTTENNYDDKKEEWVFSEDYLMYIITDIYKMKNA